MPRLGEWAVPARKGRNVPSGHCLEGPGAPPDGSQDPTRRATGTRRRVPGTLGTGPGTPLDGSWDPSGTGPRTPLGRVPGPSGRVPGPPPGGALGTHPGVPGPLQEVPWDPPCEVSQDPSRRCPGTHPGVPGYPWLYPITPWIRAGWPASCWLASWRASAGQLRTSAGQLSVPAPDLPA